MSYKMLDAKEAKEIMNDSIDREMRLIYEDIRSAAENGERSIMYYKQKNWSKHRARLVGLGYCVYAPKSLDRMIISWC